MGWSNKGGELTEDALQSFERLIGRQVPDDVLWLLRNLANGGRPNPDVFIPLHDLPGEPGFIVHGLYGIGHPRRYYDLAETYPYLPAARTKLGFPLGYDEGNGHFFLIAGGEHGGEVRYMPWDEFADPRCSRTYFVAKDVREFAALVLRGGEPAP